MSVKPLAKALSKGEDKMEFVVACRLLCRVRVWLFAAASILYAELTVCF